jgi:hypothetical protein
MRVVLALLALSSCIVAAVAAPPSFGNQIYIKGLMRLPYAGQKRDTHQQAARSQWYDPPVPPLTRLSYACVSCHHLSLTSGIIESFESWYNVDRMRVEYYDGQSRGE